MSVLAHVETCDMDGECQCGRLAAALVPYYEDGAVTLHCGDCRDILPWLAPVQHIITDPPYSEHVHTKSRAGARPLTGGWQADAVNAPSNFSRRVDFGFASLDQETREACASAFARLVQRWALVFSDVESTGLWRDDLVREGLEYVRTGAWIKVGGTPQFTGDRPGVGFECVTICHPKGKKRWNGGGSHAVWSVPIVLDRGAAKVRVHPTQKPEELIAQLIQQFTDPGETILDPFAGSGTTLAAAKRLGRKAIGIERDEAHCRGIVERLAQGALFGSEA